MIVLWLALSADPGVDYYVMMDKGDVGEVVKLAGRGYAVRLDGLDGGDIMFEAGTLQGALLGAGKRLRGEATNEDRGALAHPGAFDVEVEELLGLLRAHAIAIDHDVDDRVPVVDD